jgi:hypothetical protein
MMMKEEEKDHLNDEYHEPKEMLIDVNIEFVEIMKNIDIGKIPFWKKKNIPLFFLKFI